MFFKQFRWQQENLGVLLGVPNNGLIFFIHINQLVGFYDLFLLSPSNASRFNMPLFLLNIKIFSSAGWRQSTECDCRRRGGALLF